jgi:hypothetical protein
MNLQPAQKAYTGANMNLFQIHWSRSKGKFIAEGPLGSYWEFKTPKEATDYVFKRAHAMAPSKVVWHKSDGSKRQWNMS